MGEALFSIVQKLWPRLKFWKEKKKKGGGGSGSIPYRSKTIGKIKALKKQKKRKGGKKSGEALFPIVHTLWPKLKFWRKKKKKKKDEQCPQSSIKGHKKLRYFKTTYKILLQDTLQAGYNFKALVVHLHI